jgi:guanosine-3',5'-bis(diphosphate) 3'-pyrophosphohydrolase
VKVDLFSDEVYVFTPRGELRVFPRGATPIDFAYAIHSEVGEHCAGARVNSAIVPLRYKLHNGDTVEILTSKRQFPRKDWLEFVVSGKARHRVRHAIRQAGRERSIQLGRDLLERELRKHRLSLSQLERGGDLEQLSREQGRGGTNEELFSSVGYGRVSAARLVEKLRGEEPAEVPETAAPSRLRSLFRRGKPKPEPGIRVSGLSDVLVRFGGCCDPLPGDDVIGFVTRGRGVTVHVRDCPRVFELDPERRIDVEWDTQLEVARRIKIRVSSRDQRGILAKVTKSISAAGINIGAATITTGQGEDAIQSFELWVTDLDSLNALMKDIQRVKGVHAVERVRG